MTEPLVLSVTERAAFRECRRRWYWEYVLRRVPKTPQPNLWLGSGVHEALAAYYKTNDWDTAMAAFDRWYESNPEGEYDLYNLGRGILQHYAEYDAIHPLTKFGKVVAVESEAQIVPVLTPDGKPIPGVYLAGRIDLTLQREDGKFVIVDHKTRTHSQNSKALDVEDQLTGYCYLHWRVTGRVPVYAVYNILIKRLPDPPRILKDGSVSTDIRQNTTHSLYVQTLRELGLEGNERYYAILEYLKSPAAWERFFQREVTSRNVAEMKAFEERLYYEVMDIVAVRSNPRLAYPNPSPFRCGNCPYIYPCKAAEDGGDYEALLEYMFIESPPRYTGGQVHDG